MTPPKTPMQEIELYERLEENRFALITAKINIIKEELDKAKLEGYNLAKKEAEEMQKEFIKRLKKSWNYWKSLEDAGLKPEFEIYEKEIDKLSKEVFGGKE
jgi:hypothetical protein